MQLNEISTFYTLQIEQEFWPFWRKAFDMEHGGVFTCYSNDGEQLLSMNKYTWSQGRFLWLCAALFELAQKGKLTLDAAELERFAHQTFSFLKNNSRMANGHIYYSTSQSGAAIDEDLSIFADGFYILGMAKYALIWHSDEAYMLALESYQGCKNRIQTGQYRTEPYPIQEGFESHSISMIFLNVAEELAEAALHLGKPEYNELCHDCEQISQHILSRYMQQSGRIIELYTEEVHLKDSLLARHVNPGHAIESVWFHIHFFLKHKTANKDSEIQQLAKVTLYALEQGWDDRYGGLKRFVDPAGGDPKGNRLGDPMEQLILDTHDTKLWWPHSEALYTTLLMYKLTGNTAFQSWYDKLHQYVFSTFPHPDPTIGEWIQIRDRAGAPLNKVVALPVKDPFHIIRNMLLIIQLPDLLKQQLKE